MNEFFQKRYHVSFNLYYMHIENNYEIYLFCISLSISYHFFYYLPSRTVSSLMNVYTYYVLSNYSILRNPELSSFSTSTVIHADKQLFVRPRQLLKIISCNFYAKTYTIFLIRLIIINYAFVTFALLLLFQFLSLSLSSIFLSYFLSLAPFLFTIFIFFGCFLFRSLLVLSYTLRQVCTHTLVHFLILFPSDSRSASGVHKSTMTLASLLSSSSLQTVSGRSSSEIHRHRRRREFSFCIHMYTYMVRVF